MSGYGKRAEGIRYQEGSRSKRLPKGRAEMREPLQVLICSAPVEPGCTSHHRVLWYRLDWVSFDMDWGPLRSQCRHCCGAGGVEANPVSRPVGPGGWTGNLCSFIPFIEEQVLTCSPTLSYPASGPTEGPLCGWEHFSNPCEKIQLPWPSPPLFSFQLLLLLSPKELC